MLLLALPLALMGVLLAGAIPAQASDSCSDKTKINHDSLIKADNTAVDKTGWNCAYVYTTGNDSIGLLATEIVENVTGLGYQRAFDCHSQSGDVTIVGPVMVDGSGTVPSSATWTATNLASGSRHFTAAALWNTTTNSRYPYDGQYLRNCDNYTIGFNEVYTTSIDWSFTGGANNQVPTGEAWPFTVNLKPSNGKVISGDSVYLKASFRDDTTSDDTIVGVGTLKNNIATVYVTMKKPLTAKMWPVYGGLAYKKTTPPSLNTTPVDGSCLGGTSPNCPDGNVVRPVTFVDNPAYTPTVTMTLPTTAPGSTSADAKVSLTIPAGAYQTPFAQPPSYQATLSIYRSIDDTPNPSKDPVMVTAYYNSVGPGTFTSDEWFKLPATAGNYRYYARFSGYSANTFTSYDGVSAANSAVSKVAVTTPPVECSTLTGGTTNTYIKANNEYTDSRGYNCAYMDKFGPYTTTKNVTTSIKFTSALQYQPVASCQTPDMNDGATVEAHSGDGGGVATSYYSWGVKTTTAKTAYASALWMVRTNSTTPYAGQYTAAGSGCDYISGPYWMKANLLHMMKASLGKPSGSVAQGATSTWPVSLSSIDNFSVSGATVNIMQMMLGSPSSSDIQVGTGTITDNAGSISVTPVAGPLNFYAVLVGSNYVKPTLPSEGWTAAQSAPVNASGGSDVSISSGAPAAAFTPVDATFTPLDEAINPAGSAVARHLERTAYAAQRDTSEASRREAILKNLAPTQVLVVEKSGRDKVSATCPAGTALYTMTTMAEDASYGPQDYVLSDNKRGVSVRSKDGKPTRVQVTCRSVTSPVAIEGKLGRGSVRDDRLAVKEEGSIFTGGLGNDVMTSGMARSMLDGGLGADNLRLRGSDSSANGGFGADRLYAEGDRILLVGGMGRDSFETGSGAVVVNARDGRPGDVVTCGSAATRVLADRGDRLSGPCTRL